MICATGRAPPHHRGALHHCAPDHRLCGSARKEDMSPDRRRRASGLLLVGGFADRSLIWKSSVDVLSSHGRSPRRRGAWTSAAQPPLVVARCRRVVVRPRAPPVHDAKRTRSDRGVILERQYSISATTTATENVIQWLPTDRLGLLGKEPAEHGLRRCSIVRDRGRGDYLALGRGLSRPAAAFGGALCQFANPVWNFCTRCPCYLGV